MLAGIWDLIKLEDQPYVRTLPDLFDHALERSPDVPCLGHRPVISTNPLKVRVSVAAPSALHSIYVSQTCFLLAWQFANHYEWQTYAQVDERRRNLGSALRKLYLDGVIGGGELPTVGTWSQNRPGAVFLLYCL